MSFIFKTDSYLNMKFPKLMECCICRQVEHDHYIIHSGEKRELLNFTYLHVHVYKVLDAISCFSNSDYLDVI